MAWKPIENYNESYSDDYLSQSNESFISKVLFKKFLNSKRLSNLSLQIDTGLKDENGKYDFMFNIRFVSHVTLPKSICWNGPFFSASSDLFFKTIQVIEKSTQIQRNQSSQNSILMTFSERLMYTSVLQT